MSRSLSLVAGAVALLALPLDADAKKKKKDAEADAEAAVEVVPDTPGDAASKKFAKLLIATRIANFSPTDAAGAKFLYTQLMFAPDNTWKAQGYVEIMDERMECTESGTWTMEAAESEKVATVNWTVDKTDCGGREAGVETRAHLTIGKEGKVVAAFR